MRKHRQKHVYDTSAYQYVTSPDVPNVRPTAANRTSKVFIAVCAVIIVAALVVLGVLIYKHFEAHHVNPNTVPRGNAVTQPPQHNPAGTNPRSTTSNGVTNQ